MDVNSKKRHKKCRFSKRNSLQCQRETMSWTKFSTSSNKKAQFPQYQQKAACHDQRSSNQSYWRTAKLSNLSGKGSTDQSIKPSTMSCYQSPNHKSHHNLQTTKPAAHLTAAVNPHFLTVVQKVITVVENQEPNPSPKTANQPESAQSTVLCVSSNKSRTKSRKTTKSVAFQIWATWSQSNGTSWPKSSRRSTMKPIITI